MAHPIPTGVASLGRGLVHRVHPYGGRTHGIGPLSGTANPVAGRMLMDLWNYGSFPQVAALAVVMTGISAVVIGIILQVGRPISAG